MAKEAPDCLKRPNREGIPGDKVNSRTRSPPRRHGDYIGMSKVRGSGGLETGRQAALALEPSQSGSWDSIWMKDWVKKDSGLKSLKNTTGSTL